MQNSNRLLMIAFGVSVLLHVPAYTWLGHWYFPGNVFSVVKKDPTNPPIVYYPPERVVTVTKIVSPHKQSQLLKPAVKYRIMDTNKTNKSNNTKKSSFEHAKAKVEKGAALRPIVENVDLQDDTIRSVFFNYYELLSTLISRFAVYPHTARNNAQQGIAYISFVLKKDGSIRELVLKESSGHSELDKAAINAIQSASPFPPLPLELKKNEIRLNVPISFQID